MLFNSFAFAMFFIIVLCIYWIMPQRLKWIWLLVVSCYFYLSFSFTYVGLLIAVIISTYFGAISIERCEQRYKKSILISIIVLCVGTLFVFKYLEFALNSIGAILSIFSIKLSPFTVKLLMPVGISFYMFQSLGYVIDVYKGKIKAERHLGYYALFISFFPQIASGPIGRADKLLPQIKGKIDFDKNRAISGVALILWGYYKKLVVADTIIEYVDRVFDAPQNYTGGVLMLAALFFTIQIYCDFSGYSDIAIGSAKLMGIDLMENFRSPYLARTIKEFWSRWHISLSTWFRDYVYISLGGNRCSTIRRDFNLLVTFLVSGLWHGANVTFIVWGGLHGIGQIIENHLPKARVGIEQTSKQKSWANIVVYYAMFVIRVAFVFAFATLCWIFFRASSVSDAIYIIGNMFAGINSIGGFIQGAIGGIGILGNIRLLYIVMIIAVLIVTDVVNYDGKLAEKVVKLPTWSRVLVLSLFMVFIIIFAQKGVAAEFVYIQF